MKPELQKAIEIMEKEFELHYNLSAEETTPGYKEISCALRTLIDYCSEPKVELEEVEVAEFIKNTTHTGEYRRVMATPLTSGEANLIAKELCTHFKLSVPSKRELHREIARIGLDQDCRETDRIAQAIHSLLLRKE